MDPLSKVMFAAESGVSETPARARKMVHVVSSYQQSQAQFKSRFGSVEQYLCIAVTDKRHFAVGATGAKRRERDPGICGCKSPFVR